MKPNFTKQILLATVITLGFFTAAKAQNPNDGNQYGYDDQSAYNQPAYSQPAYTQPAYGNQSFDYYPDANVYYDNSCNHYIYNNGGAWITVNCLPVGINLFNAPHYRIYHRGPQVWYDNAIHARDFNRGGGYGYHQPVRFGGGYNRGGFNNNRGGGFRQAHYRR